MTIIFIRTLIIFVVLVIILRLMGKSQIGEMQPFEFVITLIIADLACVPMADVSIPLTYGLTAVLALFLFHQLLSLLEQSGSFFKKVISGKPSLVINKDGVDIKELKNNNMDINELIESMRGAGYFNLDDVDYAIFESNGKLSALESKNKSDSASLPIVLVYNGKPDKKNMLKAHLTNEKIQAFFKSKKENIKNTEVMTIDGNGRVYLKQKNKKYTITSIPIKRSELW